MNQTHATPRTASRCRLALSEARKSAIDCLVSLMNALYYLCMYELPAQKKAVYDWAKAQEERFATRLFADEPWENPTKPEQPGSNVYSEPFETPHHFYDEDGRWDAAPDWVMWVALGVCVTVAGWLFYLWPELMIGIVMVVCSGLLYLAFRK